MILLLIMAAPIDPIERCAAFGDAAILGDSDKYKSAQYLVKKDAPPCIVYHAAMAKVRLADKGGAGYLRQAAQLLAKIGPEEPIVEQWARVRRLEIALRLQDPSLAPDMTGVPAQLPSPEKRWLLETSLLGFADPDKALDTYAAKPFPRGHNRLMQIADMLVMLENDDSRRPPLLAELYRDYPDAWITPKEWPKQLGALPNDVLLDRLTLMTSRHANQSVLVNTAKALKGELPPDVKCQVLYHKGVAHRKLRQYAPAERTLVEALEVCQQVLAKTPQNEAVATAAKKAWYTLGQVQSIFRPFEIAKPTLVDFVAKYKDDALADDVLWFAVTSAEKARETDEAAKLVEQILKEYAQGHQCAEAHFRVCYDLYKAGEYAQAEARFAKAALGPCTQDHVQQARAYYWQARSQARQEKDATAALQLTYKTSPLSYYGMLARLRLDGETPEIVAPPASPSPEPEVGPPVSKPASPFPTERVRVLTKYGMYAEAQAELTARKPADEDVATHAALLAEAHDYHHAHFPYRKALKPTLGAFTHDRAAWHVAYPRPFEAHIKKAEIEEKLPRDLLLALIREESAFQVDAGSWANAFGLTQLLVETAERAAADMPGFDKVPSADLLRKEGITSIKLGAHLLGMLQKRFRAVPLMLAAYNAGEEWVDHWARARGYLPTDEFIEEIPIDETRGYVKRILWTWNVYRHLGEKDAPTVSLGRAYKPVTLAQE